MMLIFSVIIMCRYLYSVCQVCLVLKNTYFKEYLSVVASKYRICNTENSTQEFKLCSMFKHSPNGKGMIYCRNLINPNGEGVMATMEYTSWLIAPMEKVQSIKNKMSIEISFLHYMNRTRIMLTVVFEEFEVVCIFLAVFFFSL